MLRTSQHSSRTPVESHRCEGQGWRVQSRQGRCGRTPERVNKSRRLQEVVLNTSTGSCGPAGKGCDGEFKGRVRRIQNWEWWLVNQKVVLLFRGTTAGWRSGQRNTSWVQQREFYLAIPEPSTWQRSARRRGGMRSRTGLGSKARWEFRVSWWQQLNTVHTLLWCLEGSEGPGIADESRQADTATNHPSCALTGNGMMKSSKLIYHMVICLTSLALQHINHCSHSTGDAASVLKVIHAAQGTSTTKTSTCIKGLCGASSLLQYLEQTFSTHSCTPQEVFWVWRG